MFFIFQLQSTLQKQFHIHRYKIYQNKMGARRGKANVNKYYGSLWGGGGVTPDVGG